MNRVTWSRARCARRTRCDLLNDTKLLHLRANTKSCVHVLSKLAHAWCCVFSVRGLASAEREGARKWTHTYTHTIAYTRKPEVVAQQNQIGEWIISQSSDKKIYLFSLTIGCFQIHTTFNTKPWDISWQLQEVSSLMFPLISSSCSKWRCGSGCDYVKYSVFLQMLGFFFFFFGDWRTWFSRDPFLMNWRRQLSLRKDEMNTGGGLCWQRLNGCFLPPSRLVSVLGLA